MARSAPAVAKPRRVRPLEQLAFELGPVRPRWSFSRRVLVSPHRERIRERLEFVRRFFPELDGITVRVGMALKRGVLGWGSLDPERPGEESIGCGANGLGLPGELGACALVLLVCAFLYSSRGVSFRR